MNHLSATRSDAVHAPAAGSSAEWAYKGLAIRGASGLHDLAAQTLLSVGCAREVRTLDIGAGEGAFTRRLLDLGFSNVEALDIDGAGFRVPEVHCHVIDLDSDGWADSLGSYGLIVALETIEHLENPWRFFRNLGRLLQPGGHLLLSSPNVTSWYSRLLFLRHGELHWFGYSRLLSDGHRAPVFGWQVAAMAEPVGMRVVKTGTTADISLRRRVLFHRGVLRGVFSRFFVLASALRPLMSGNCCGEVTLWTLRRDRE
jgi:2-polyprenyl-3-methyl-5-hydroxy-6-metoxy-1,4-benzoquinol methylase